MLPADGTKLGGIDISNKNMRRLSMLVTAQTAANLEKLAKMCGYGQVGHVVDKLVREKMIQMRDWDRPEEKQRFYRPTGRR